MTVTNCYYEITRVTDDDVYAFRADDPARREVLLAAASDGGRELVDGRPDGWPGCVVEVVIDAQGNMAIAPGAEDEVMP